VVVVSTIVGAVMSALTAAMSALPEELLMAVRDEGGKDGEVATRVLADRARIRARHLAGRVMSVAALATATAQLVAAEMPIALGLVIVAAAALGYALFSEVAQTIARSRARVHGLRMLRWSRPLELLFAPFALPIQAVSRMTEHFFPVVQEVSPDIAAREVEHMIEKREEEGAIPEEYAQLLLRVLEFKDTVAREVMVPRTRMIAIDLATPISEVSKLVVEEGHSRYPVYRERVDRIEGILHAKDYFRFIRDHAREAPDLAKIARKPALFVAESQRIGQVLREMQSKRQHLALVVDEFGGTAGLVTLEDILEEIVGEIQDEHDTDERLVEQTGPDTFVADARVSIHELGEVLEQELGGAAQDAEADSLGGLVVGFAGKVPDVGEHLEIDGLQMIVREADEKHVTRVEIRRRTTRPPGPVEPAEGAA
jgi:putative hemolysin